MPPATRRPVLLVLLFVVYLVLLTWIILWKLTVPWVGEAAFLPHPIKLIPFFPSGDADESNFLEVVANFLFFVPFGLYLGLLAPRWRWWMLTGVFVVASLVLEVTQHLLSIGSFDITDVLMNTLGGVAGLGVVVLARRRFGARVGLLMTRALVIGTVLSLIAIGIYVASPLRYAPQHDVIFGRSNAGSFVISV